MLSCRPLIGPDELEAEPLCDNALDMESPLLLPYWPFEDPLGSNDSCLFEPVDAVTGVEKDPIAVVLPKLKELLSLLLTFFVV